MLLKWIICEVPENNREAFANTQQDWRKLKTVAGFLGQVGGWDSREQNQACILGFWADAQAYAAFMEREHDLIYGQSGQKGTYVASHVVQVEVLFDIDGTHQKMQSAINEAEVLRVADCKLKTGREEHFIEMQKSVWNPAMAKTGGMLAGAFGIVLNEVDRFLVTTFWRDEAAHQAYVKNPLPALQVKAKIREDLQNIEGRVVRLNSTWRVV